MLHCTPFLLFDGNCAEAMTFYQKCLGGELTLTKLGDTPMKDQLPPEKHNRIINAYLKSGAIGIFVIGGTYDELKVVFDKLADGAKKEWFQELHDMPFGSYGQFFDKYGVQWIFKGEKKEEGTSTNGHGRRTS